MRILKHLKQKNDGIESEFYSDHFGLSVEKKLVDHMRLETETAVGKRS